MVTQSNQSICLPSRLANVLGTDTGDSCSLLFRLQVFFGADDTWVEKAMIPTARFRTAAATAGGLTFVFGGSDACIDRVLCPALDTTAVFLDVDHPHVYIYLKDDAYNDNAALTTYPV